jgi:[acyl-carrier-protein] S-malonyltransferase
LVAEAEAATGVDLTHLLLDAGPDELRATDAAQLQVLTASLLAWRAVEPTIDADDLVGFAGHSLGQITALIAAGVLDLADGFRLATARAHATRAAQDHRPGRLVALLGADAAGAEAACASHPGQAWVANVNGAGQVVIGAEAAVIDLVAEEAVERGARRAIPLDVGGAFHTPLMQGAADELAPVLAGLEFRAPSRPVVTNHDGRAVTGADGWPARLTDHLTHPVRWEACVQALEALGAESFVEVGPGTTLAGLVRRIAPGAAVVSVGAPAGLWAEVDR